MRGLRRGARFSEIAAVPELYPRGNGQDADMFVGHSPDRM